MATVNVGFKRLTDGAVLPTKAHATDSGFDLVASEDVVIEPGATVVVPTGIAIQLPEGYEAQVRPRSGVTSKTKLRVQLGTIDEGYGGEIGVIVDNNTQVGREDRGVNYIDGSPEYYESTAYHIRKGDRVAQLVIQPLPNVGTYEITGEINSSERGANGYGSTGTTSDLIDVSSAGDGSEKASQSWLDAFGKTFDKTKRGDYPSE